jgi:hypothetical protein
MADVRAARYTAAPVTRRRTREIVLEAFGRSSFAAQAAEGPGADGFVNLVPVGSDAQSCDQMLGSLETAGLKTRHPLTGDISLSVKGEAAAARAPCATGGPPPSHWQIQRPGRSPSTCGSHRTPSRRSVSAG